MSTNPTQPDAWRMTANAYAATSTQQGEPCPHCGAPCRKDVLMRGGDNGWGDDASRTVYRYTATSAPGVDDAMVGSVVADIQQAAAKDGCLHIVLKDEWVREALEAAITQSTEGSGPSVAGGERA